MEDLVSNEITKKLIEKGFPILYYTDSKMERKSFDPTIYEVLKWLREEKNIILTPNPSYFEEDCCLGWDCDVWASGNYDYCCVDYKTYEQASIAGIEYVLDNLI